MYTLLRVARMFYEMHQVKRNHSVSSGVSLTNIIILLLQAIFYITL